MARYFDPLAGGYVDDAAPTGVYGEIYELITGDPADGPHPYVGLGRGENGAYERVYSDGRAHTRPASIAKAPWKANILPAPHGFRVLERIPATGDDAEDERTLRTAEAYWIRKLHTTHNRQRPAYEHGQPGSLRKDGRSSAAPRVRQPSRAELAAAAKRRSVRRRIVVASLICAVFAFLAGRIFAGADMGTEPVAWAMTPAIGIAAGAPTFLWLDRQWRRLTGRRR